MSTFTKTFTLTDAKYLGSKVAADLHQMQRFYGQPSDTDINNYVDELVILLKGGYVQSVDYGFQKNGIWVVALSYEVSGLNMVDDNPGRVPPYKDISGAVWNSYLRKSQKYWELSEEERDSIQRELPVLRVGASDPQIGANGSYDKTYGSGGVELRRKTFN